jgi:hypothetical protein
VHSTVKFGQPHALTAQVSFSIGVSLNGAIGDRPDRQPLLIQLSDHSRAIREIALQCLDIITDPRNLGSLCLSLRDQLVPLVKQILLLSVG